MRAPKTPTLHKQIISDIEGCILSGAWPPGHRIANEMDLAQQYNCSRMTVNKALSQLAKANLIERRKKSGSFVTQPQAQSAILEIHDIKSEVQSLGLPYRYSRTSRVQRISSPGDMKNLDLPDAADIVEVVGKHYAGPRVFCLEERLINLAVVPEAKQEDFVADAPGPWLTSHIPWTTAEHLIKSVGADTWYSGALGVTPGTSCLVIERRTWSHNGPVTHVRLTYPGDRHALVARFTPTDPTRKSSGF
ncbi:histidine utilization repressor [Thalassospira sp. MCCC 1A01428]|uniref:histidine utilization repressor n=1 Tax=Thalassospira sp. MCCC 1A01428 TaxID=1470575 RepID=UPI000A1EB732|nr:histidine utilization repressor [Thalassospira sp. MCCC 1A01428]OSQ43704.1 GntR family transcriptional regulator [Thalassospira sp. MCCC 1A01428]